MPVFKYFTLQCIGECPIDTIQTTIDKTFQNMYAFLDC